MGRALKTSSDDEVAQHWRQLSGDFYRIGAALERALQESHQLSAIEFDVLDRLANADRGELRMSELAPQVALSQSALSRLISRLETDGLAERHACADDRRSVFAKITGSGAQRYTAAKPTQRAALRAASQGCEVGELLCDGT